MEAPPQVIVSDVVLGPVESVSESPAAEASEDDSGGPGGFGSGFVGLVDTSSFTSEALIEEPVASGSDSSLWTDGPEDQCDETRETCAPTDGVTP